MSPARAQLESVVDALRRKQLTSIALTALVELVLVAALMYALLRIGLPNIVLSKPRRLVLAAGLLLVFVAAILLEQARQTRSMMFLAKRIDHENQLDDHLVSALSFADPPSNGFEQACVNSLVLRLQAQALRIPEVRFERLWLLIPALIIAAGTGAIDYRRRVRPEDDGSVKVTLPADLRDRVVRLDQVSAAAAKIDPVLARRAKETRDLIDKLVERQASKESVLRDLSTARDALGQYEAQNPSLVDAALQLGDPATQRASKLLQGLRAGQPAQVSDALRTITDALSGKTPPPLTDEERAEIAAILEALAQATHAAQLSKQLNEAGEAVRRHPTGPEAARPLDKLHKPLVDELTREAAAKQLTSSIRSALADVGRQAELAARKAQTPLKAPPEQGHDLGINNGGNGVGLQVASNDGENDDAPGGEAEGGTASGGTGAGTAVDPEFRGGAPETPETGVDTRLASQWVGAPVRQLVAAGSSSDPGAQKAARAILTTQQRQLEREVRREEIPAEYAQSIRRYFSNIQRAWEREWKPSK